MAPIYELYVPVEVMDQITVGNVTHLALFICLSRRCLSMSQMTDTSCDDQLSSSPPADKEAAYIHNSY